MLINNNMKNKDISTAEIGDINNFLNQEKEYNKTQPWSKFTDCSYDLMVIQFYNKFASTKNYF